MRQAASSRPPGDRRKLPITKFGGGGGASGLGIATESAEAVDPRIACAAGTPRSLPLGGRAAGDEVAACRCGSRDIELSAARFRVPPSHRRYFPRLRPYGIREKPPGAFASSLAAGYLASWGQASGNDLVLAG